MNHLDDGGRIAVGALADLVVLDRDITAVPTSEIAQTRVDLTFVDGVMVHERSPTLAGLTPDLVARPGPAWAPGDGGAGQ